MNRYRVKGITSLTGILVAMSSTAFAADSGAYIGASLGQSTYSEGAVFKDWKSVSIDPKVDKSDTSWKITAGYHVTKNLAVEASYVDLGKISAEDPPYGDKLTAKASGIAVQAVGIMPIQDKFSAYGKLGFINAKVKADYNDPNPPALRDGISKTSTSLAYGLGLAYEVAPKVCIHLEWSRYQSIGKNDDPNSTTFTGPGKYNVNVIGLGANYKF